VKQALASIALIGSLCWANVASAVPVVEDKEKGILINVGALIQPTFQMTTPGSNGAGPGACGTATRPRCSPGIGNAEGDGPSFDFFLRRARIMVWGSVTKELSFFVDTDEPNLGRGGTFNTSTFIQDAFLTYSFMPEFRIDAGLMLVPLSHHTLEGATSLNALDYHADTIRFPTGRIFRDAGIQFRGVALDDYLHYRLGIFQGVRNGAIPAPPMGAPARSVANPNGIPRFTGHLRGNIVGVEPDFFFKGIYFSPTPIVSLGVGADYQPASVYKTNGRGNYFALSADVFAELPFTADDELIAKVNFFHYSPGATFIGNSTLPTGAMALYAEAGFRHAWIEPVVQFDYVKAQDDALTIMSPHVGVNFWVMKHNMNVKTDFAYRETDRPANLPTYKDILWTTQGQLFF
jgi:hypothetical protein